MEISLSLFSKSRISMVYFIHGFEWPYDKENTAMICEYNDLESKDLSIGKIVDSEIKTQERKNREIIIHNDTPKNFFKIIDGKIHLDELVYRNETNEIIKNYGFISKDDSEESFWKTFIKTIDVIAEENPETRKIRIPISLFMKLYENRSKELLLKIYDVLSPKENFDFFILLDNPNDIHFVYDNFNIQDNFTCNVFAEKSQIISCFYEAEKFEESMSLKETNLGLGVCDYNDLELCFLQYCNVDEIKNHNKETIDEVNELFKKKQ